MMEEADVVICHEGALGMVAAADVDEGHSGTKTERVLMINLCSMYR